MSSIDEMKQSLGLQEVCIYYAEVPNAEAQLINGKPCILINPQLQLKGNALLFVIGHELGHIASGDLSGTKSKSQNVLHMLIMVTILLFFFFWHYFSLAWLLVCFFFILALDFYISHIFDNAMQNFFYCEQMKELRADRIGFRISGVRLEDVKEAARLMPDDSEYYQKPSLVDRLLIQFRIMPKPDDLHPFWSIRVNELKKHGGERWSIKDDIRYTWKFSFGLLFGNDWRI